MQLGQITDKESKTNYLVNSFYEFTFCDTQKIHHHAFLVVDPRETFCDHIFYTSV
jgi:hypothetical protein